MPDPETAALLRSILDELCIEVPISDQLLADRVTQSGSHSAA